MPASEHQAEHAVASTSGATSGDGLSPTTSAADLTPTAAWSRRVRWIGGLIQAAFAAFWLVRGSAVIGGRAADVLIAVFGVTVIGVFSYAIRATAGTAPRPKSREGKRIERGVTIATVIEFAAAIVLPVDRDRRRSLRLGAAVDRDHDRTAVAVARPPSPYPTLPAGRVGADRRTGDPRRDDVRHAACRDHGHRRRRTPARHRASPASTTSREFDAQRSRPTPARLSSLRAAGAQL